ncbi:MAG: hypothetical protein QNK37_12050 [Acidobacteriota bacterium]|nr:hypothetical protein [Acidobacteriota bacterium]
MKVMYFDSDLFREKWLDRMLKTAELTVGFGAGLLPRSLVNQGTALISAFPLAAEAKTQALSTRHKLVKECDRNLDYLGEMCRSFWRMLKARALVLGHSSEIFKIFGLNASGKFLAARYKRDWLKHARSLIKAETVAVERGYPAMDLPTVTAVSEALALAEASCQGVDQANLAHQSALSELKAVRNQVDELNSDVYAYLRFALRSLSAPRRREVMRRYGFIFKGDPVDVSDEDTTPDQQEETPGESEPSDQGGSDQPAEEEPPPEDSGNGSGNEAGAGTETTTPQP